MTDLSQGETKDAAPCSRNLVICCDGTNNEFGPENTNVVRLAQVISRDPAKQHLYYDPGVGTLPEPNAFTYLQRKMSDLAGLAFGAGLTRKVGQAYSFLMDFWEPGDRVFLFGFSRGAYAARVLAGLLHSLGLLPHGNHNLVPYVLELFKAVRKQDPRNKNADGSNYWKLCNEFRWTFARRVAKGDDQRRFPVHFLGVWDTVSSVGWVWDPVKFPYTAHNPSIDIIRHAVSIDERRWFFRQNLMEKAGDQDLEELWFPGVHCDVGGGYPEKDGGLWRAPFQWMLDEATKAGLHVNPDRLDHVLQRTNLPQPQWLEPQHESLTAGWWPCELFPKLVRCRRYSCRLPCIGMGRHRHIVDKALIHKSALLRIRDKPDYSPLNFPRAFLEKIRGLSEAPDTLPFER